MTEYLQHSKNELETLTYVALEGILGFKLPNSAYDYRPWWANSDHVQAEGWTTAGWKVRTVNLGRSVIFERFKHPLPASKTP